MEKEKHEPKETTKQEEKKPIEKLRKAIKKEEHKADAGDAKIQELTETLQRLQADFENYRKRVDIEKKGFIAFANAELIAGLLPILDSFEMALMHAEKKEEFIKGVELIYSQLYSLLGQYGLRPIKALGEKFDPYKHEVLMKGKSDKEEDVILEELQKGYMLENKVLRHSKVKVSEK